MPAITVDLPDAVAERLHAMVDAGWFKSDQEAVCFAVAQFLGDNKLALTERQQLDDVRWAVTSFGKS